MLKLLLLLLATIPHNIPHDSLARSYLGGALPFVYDDPSSDRVLKPLLMNSFGGAEMGTQRQQFVARCSPIITANEFILEDLAKADKW